MRESSEVVPGVNQPIIAQRVIEHDIRLREGEMNILGGVFQSSTARSTRGIPGLSQIPLLKYLFSNVSTSISENEVLIVLRPRTVRLPDITPLNLRAIDVGTEGDVRVREAPPAFDQEGAEPEAAPPDGPESPAAPPPEPAAEPAPGTPPGPTAISEPAPASYASLRFEDIAAPQAGEQFELPLRIENASDIFSFPFELQYDAGAVKFLGARKGDFWTADGKPVAVVERPEQEDGNTVVTLSLPPGSGGVSGDGTVAVLMFQAERSGETSLEIIASGARSPSNRVLPVQSAQARVAIR